MIQNISSEPAIVVDGLGKEYKLFQSPGQRMRYHLFHWDAGKSFSALSDVSFSISKGETFGIIGKNGSGKSTILQMLAGIVKPTSGTLQVNGKVAALLELGSGFNPESTGVENIYMNAAILGVGKKELEGKIEDIIEFADIGDFIYQPVKTYSSGMYIRLAFSVAINVDADIILIDEALAVGDIFFRQKCYAKLNEMKEQGKTVILVTHGMGEVEQFCDRAILLNKGKQLMIGRSQDVVKQYYLINQDEDIAVPSSPEIENSSENCTQEIEWNIKEHIFFDLSHSKEISNGKAAFMEVGLFNKDGLACRMFEQGEEAYFFCRIIIFEDIMTPVVGLALYDQKNNIVYGKNSLQIYVDMPPNVKGGSTISVLKKVSLELAEGEYTFEMGISEIDPYQYKRREMLPQEELFMYEKRICHRNRIGIFAISLKKHGSPTRLTHHGICNLPTEMNVSIK